MSAPEDRDSHTNMRRSEPGAAQHMCSHIDTHCDVLRDFRYTPEPPALAAARAPAVAAD
ncbi:hypothetical protein DSM112329_04377 [Paraconexibacter sp. AEG42_29]|uniref:Uncharacterized protein n=1 Tax=Paraconexibacter sp. AEG42_29 TaxID=2997339 RepID=A0AAU7B0Q6_9ACTN